MSRPLAMVMLTSSIAFASDPKLLEEARQHERHAHALVGEMAFREAIADYSRAFELAPSPVFLYNIGYLYYRLGEHEPTAQALPDMRSATLYLKRYLAELPSAPDRDLVEGWVRKMEQEIPKLEQVEAEALRRSEEESKARAGKEAELEERVRTAELAATAADRRVADERAARLRVEEEARKQRERVKLGLMIAGVGLGIAVAGAAGLGVGVSEYNAVQSIALTKPSLGNFDSPIAWTAIGGVVTGVGVAAIVGGSIIAAPARSPVSVAVSGTRVSASVTLSGAF